MKKCKYWSNFSATQEQEDYNNKLNYNFQCEETEPHCVNYNIGAGKRRRVWEQGCDKCPFFVAATATERVKVKNFTPSGEGLYFEYNGEPPQSKYLRDKLPIVSEKTVGMELN